MRTVEEIYTLAESDLRTRRWLDSVSMYNSLALLDPKTGKSLKRPLSDVMVSLAELQSERVVLGNDRIARLTAHCRVSIRKLLRKGLNRKFRQILDSVPVREAHEFNQESFMRIALRPGRTLREKLAGKSDVDAVQNVSIVDLPENRLVKACVKRLVKVIASKLSRFPKAVSEDDQKLLQEMRAWLRSDVASQIGEWRSPPPNNALLSHRDYRLIWDAWRDLCSLAENLEQDLEPGKAKERWDKFKEWDKRLKQHVKDPLPDCPVDFDDDEGVPYELLPEGQPRVVDVHRGEGVSPLDEAVEGLSCVDLRRDCPVYACQKGIFTMREAFIWQRREYNDEYVSMPFWRATKYYIGVPDVRTITFRDLFKDEEDEDMLSSAALCFCEKLAERFSKATVGWLLPDSVDDFDVRLLRRYLNVALSGAEPIPTSVALLFEQEFPDKIPEGYTVSVADRKSRTYLIAHTDKSTILLNRSPESRGVYWERTSVLPARVHRELKYDITRPPVAGGLRFMKLQLSAGDEPLWCDCLPQLVMKVFGRDLVLVRREKTIRPIFGVPVNLEIEAMRGRVLDLVAGKVEYSFPLIVGDGKKKTAYKAVLTDSSFPLSANVSCSLSLTYTLGADDPYELLFVPMAGGVAPFQKLKVKWERMAKDDVENLPVLTPPFSPPSAESKAKTRKALTFFDLPSDPAAIDDLIFGRPNIADYVGRDRGHAVISEIPSAPERVEAEVTSVKTDRGFCFARLWDGTSVFCHVSGFVDENEFDGLDIEDRVWLVAKPRSGRTDLQGSLISRAKILPDAVLERFRKDFCFAESDKGNRIFCHRGNFVSQENFASLKVGDDVWLSESPSPKKCGDPHGNFITVGECITEQLCQLKRKSFGAFKDAALLTVVGDVSTVDQRQFVEDLFDRICSRAGDLIACVRLSRVIWTTPRIVELITPQVADSAARSAVEMLRMQLSRIRKFRSNIRAFEASRDVGTDLRFILGLLLCRGSANLDVRERFSRSSSFFKHAFNLLKEAEVVCKEFDIQPYVTGLQILRGGKIVQGIEFLQLVVHYLAGETEEASIEIRTIEED